MTYTRQGGEQFAHRNASLFDEEHYKANLGDPVKGTTNVSAYQHPYNFLIALNLGDCRSAMSFGQMLRNGLHRYLTCTARQDVADHIAQLYGMDEYCFGLGCFATLPTVRNFCAHHEKLWDSHFITTKLRLPKRMGSNYSAKARVILQPRPDNAKLYNTLVMVMYHLDQ